MKWEQFIKWTESLHDIWWGGGTMFWIVNPNPHWNFFQILENRDSEGFCWSTIKSATLFKLLFEIIIKLLISLVQKYFGRYFEFWVHSWCWAAFVLFKHCFVCLHRGKLMLPLFNISWMIMQTVPSNSLKCKSYLEVDGT